MWQAKGKRTFPLITLGPGQSEVQQVGNTTCPKFGWVMAYRKDVPGNDQLCAVNVAGAAPGAFGLNADLCRFSPGEIGQVLFPWPQVTATIVTDPGLPGVVDWRADFLPIDDPADAAGIPAVVDTAQARTVVGGAPITLLPPPGVTQWAIFPDAAIPVNIQAESVVNGVVTVLGSWNVGGTPPNPPPDLLPMNWKRTTVANFQLVITVGGGLTADITVFWKMDMRNWGDPGSR